MVGCLIPPEYTTAVGPFLWNSVPNVFISCHQKSDRLFFLLKHGVFLHGFHAPLLKLECHIVHSCFFS